MKVGEPDVGPVVGDSAAIQEARRLIETYASTTLPILLVGATGTGKELLARHIHRLSKRLGRWVPVNCAALPQHTAESLLFGHRRGAFSGAVESRRGYLRSAHQGTLFLDELVELASEVQPKLLRALDLGEVHPLSEDLPSEVDMRVLAAAQENVWAKLRTGDFRRDLLQRIAGVVIRLPPLRERPEDILPLARHFASAQGQELEAATAPILLSYSWPGNVRELRQSLERARALVSNGTLSAAALAQAIELGAPIEPVESAPVAMRLNNIDTLRTSLLRTLSSHEWDACRTAAALRIHRATLFRQLKVCGLSIRALRKSQ